MNFTQRGFGRLAFGLMTTSIIAGASPVVAAPVPAGPPILPGTQPGEGDLEFAKVQQCIMCHSRTPNGAADPMFSWQGGLMAQAARDPVFRAALAVANQDVPEVGSFCLRCHTPRGWLSGRAEEANGSTLTAEDLHGVSCDVCHRLVDPRGPEAGVLADSVPLGFGNAMMVMDPKNVVRGPYGDGKGAMPHQVVRSEFHGSSELCGTCHNVSNPLQAENPGVQPPHTFGRLDRTYSEWLLSDFAKRGRDGTCQACHYEAVPGGGQPSRFGGQRRDHFVFHGPAGGSTWVQDAIAHLWGKEVNTKALEAGRERARALLRGAATLDVSFPDAGRARLRITNLTGHKLPTGYAEGRRMWVNARFLDAGGAVLDEIGRYAETERTLAGAAVTVPTLLDPDRTRVYESIPGLSPAQAERYGKKPGKSFHIVLNDVILKDNRIPPEGFVHAAFAEHQCEPVGASYADGQYWDDVDLPVPPGTTKVMVRLMYQSVSWEYIRFLVEENRTDDWSRRLYEAWKATGSMRPEICAELTIDVTP